MRVWEQTPTSIPKGKEDAPWPVAPTAGSTTGAAGRERSPAQPDGAAMGAPATGGVGPPGSFDPTRSLVATPALAPAVNGVAAAAAVATPQDPSAGLQSFAGARCARPSPVRPGRAGEGEKGKRSGRARNCAAEPLPGLLTRRSTCCLHLRPRPPPPLLVPAPFGEPRRRLSDRTLLPAISLSAASRRGPGQRSGRGPPPPPLLTHSVFLGEGGGGE